MDKIICRFKGYKKIGLMIPKVYDVYEILGFEEDDEYDEDDFNFY